MTRPNSVTWLGRRPAATQRPVTHRAGRGHTHLVTRSVTPLYAPVKSRSSSSRRRSGRARRTKGRSSLRSCTCEAEASDAGSLTDDARQVGRRRAAQHLDARGRPAPPARARRRWPGRRRPSPGGARSACARARSRRGRRRPSRRARGRTEPSAGTGSAASPTLRHAAAAQQPGEPLARREAPQADGGVAEDARVDRRTGALVRLGSRQGYYGLGCSRSRSSPIPTCPRPEPVGAGDLLGKRALGYLSWRLDSPPSSPARGARGARRTICAPRAPTTWS